MGQLHYGMNNQQWTMPPLLFVHRHDWSLWHYALRTSIVQNSLKYIEKKDKCHPHHVDDES